MRSFLTILNFTRSVRKSYNTGVISLNVVAVYSAFLPIGQ